MFQITILLTLLSLFGYATDFASILKKSKNGDYIVAVSGKVITLIHIRSITDTSLILEEITTSSKNLKNQPTSWPEWVKNKAPGHSSWALIEIDLQKGKILQSYSFSQASWMQESSQTNLFATLLQLELKSVAPQDLRRIGPPPSEGESDFRKIWNPPLVFEGRPVEKSAFDVFETTWPRDGSELDGKKITLYFDQDRRVALPFWMQIDTSHLVLNFHIIDSGKNLISPLRMPTKR